MLRDGVDMHVRRQTYENALQAQSLGDLWVQHGIAACHNKALTIKNRCRMRTL